MVAMKSILTLLITTTIMKIIESILNLLVIIKLVKILGFVIINIIFVTIGGGVRSIGLAEIKRKIGGIAAVSLNFIDIDHMIANFFIITTIIVEEIIVVTIVFIYFGALIVQILVFHTGFYILS